ncbi:MAG: hypothetical protein JWM59_4092 [Verrucomicrobiales bacterium]|nr:hypothetical protein [Verrucomicrobiales bacterium]
MKKPPLHSAVHHATLRCALAFASLFLFAAASAPVLADTGTEREKQETVQGPPQPPLRGLSRDSLLEYRSAGGSIQTAPTAAEWENGRRREALEAFLSIIGPGPADAGQPRPSPPGPRMEVRGETDCGSYVRRFISYRSGSGGSVPAWLCIPKAALGGRSTPAVLCLHPTDGLRGHDTVVEPCREEYPPYAAELAALGFVTLSPSYPLMAGYKPDLKALGFTGGGTLKAVRDNISALDLLETLPFVRREAGFGVIGHSLGGHNAVFTSVLEPRLKAIVSSCGFDSFTVYMNGDLRGWTQERYMPKLGTYLGRPRDVPFDFFELISALAPRHVFISAPKGDSNFRWESVRRITEAARPVYRLYGAEDRLKVHHPEAGHVFPEDTRRDAFAMLLRVLGTP